MRNLRVASLAAAALLAILVCGTTASAQGPNKCLPGKNKCASKKTQSILKCWIKAEKAGVAVDSVCISKARAKFGGTCDGGVNVDQVCDSDADCPASTCAGGCFTKLEEKDAGSSDPLDTCSTFNDAPAMEAKVDAFVDDILSDLDPFYPGVSPASKCDAGKKKCVLKKVASILKCHEKAVKGGLLLDPTCVDKARGKFGGFCDGGVNVDQVCLQDSDCPGSTCEKGCFTKLEDEDIASSDPLDTCHSSPGNAPVEEAKADAFIQDVLCELGFTTLVCGGPTPTPAPTVTVTPTPGGPCPTTFQFTETGANADADYGWTGLAHDSHFPTDGRVTLAVSGCANPTTPCGQCNVSGPIANAGGTTFANRRCRGDGVGNNGSWIQCTSDTDCPGSGNACTFFLAAPQPIGVGGVGTCHTTEIEGPVGGTVDPGTGSASLSMTLTTRIYFEGSTGDPCARCVGGVCMGGQRNGQGCTVNGVNAQFGDNLSFDCPPSDLSILGVSHQPLQLATGTQTRMLTAASPNCRATGHTAEKCFCDTCNNAAATVCSTNADCTAVGATICGGRRCQGGPNAGTPCLVNSECPTSNACGVPGLATASNECSDATCTPAPSDTDSTDEGVCAADPQVTHCTMQTYLECLSDGDCSPTLPGDTCNVGSPEKRECFTTNGVVGDDVSVGGVASPTSPTLGALFCMQPVSAGAANSAYGMPGLGRLTLRGTAVFN
jgi:hypothetical protein